MNFTWLWRVLSFLLASPAYPWPLCEAYHSRCFYAVRGLLSRCRCQNFSLPCQYFLSPVPCWTALAALVVSRAQHFFPGRQKFEFEFGEDLLPVLKGGTTPHLSGHALCQTLCSQSRVSFVRWEQAKSTGAHPSFSMSCFLQRTCLFLLSFSSFIMFAETIATTNFSFASPHSGSLLARCPPTSENPPLPFHRWLTWVHRLVWFWKFHWRTTLQGELRLGTNTDRIRLYSVTTSRS